MFQWLSDFWDSFTGLSGTQISVNLNRCAGQQSNQLYSKAIGNGKLLNAFLGNTFASGSQLLLGPTTQDRVAGGMGIAASGPQPQSALNVAVQGTAQTVGRIQVLGGTQIAAVPGSEIALGGQTRFATEISRYTAVAVKDTPAFANVLGKVSRAFGGKLLVDGATYLATEAGCAIGH